MPCACRCACHGAVGCGEPIYTFSCDSLRVLVQQSNLSAPLSIPRLRRPLRSSALQHPVQLGVCVHKPLRRLIVCGCACRLCQRTLCGQGPANIHLRVSEPIRSIVLFGVHELVVVVLWRRVRCHMLSCRGLCCSRRLRRSCLLCRLHHRNDISTVLDCCGRDFSGSIVCGAARQQVFVTFLGRARDTEQLVQHGGEDGGARPNRRKNPHATGSRAAGGRSSTPRHAVPRSE